MQFHTITAEALSGPFSDADNDRKKDWLDTP